MESTQGGSLQDGLSEKTKITQEKPRESGQGERPPKGSGTTVKSGK